MELKRHIFSIMLCILPCAGSATGVFAPDRGDAGSLNRFPVRVLPVLVRVDANGDVTRVAPAYQLSPRFSQLLDATVSEMVSAPAVDKQGKPMSSQFVLNLALDTTPRDDGSYDTRFRYLSTQPVPSGRWGWSHRDGYELALLDLNHPVSRSATSVTPEYPRGDAMRSQIHAPAQNSNTREISVRARSSAGQMSERGN